VNLFHIRDSVTDLSCKNKFMLFSDLGFPSNDTKKKLTTAEILATRELFFLPELLCHHHMTDYALKQHPTNIKNFN